MERRRKRASQWRCRAWSRSMPWVCSLPTNKWPDNTARHAGGVEGFRKKEVEKLARRDLAPGSTIVSGGLSCRPAVGKAGCSHRTMVTGSGKKAANRTPFRWVNTTLGNIKTALAGTYHYVSAKHARHYLTSFAYRLYGASGVKL